MTRRAAAPVARYSKADAWEAFKVVDGEFHGEVLPRLALLTKVATMHDDADGPESLEWAGIGHVLREIREHVHEMHRKAETLMQIHPSDEAPEKGGE